MNRTLAPTDMAGKHRTGSLAPASASWRAIRRADRQSRATNAPLHIDAIRTPRAAALQNAEQTRIGNPRNDDGVGTGQPFHAEF